MVQKRIKNGAETGGPPPGVRPWLIGAVAVLALWLPLIWLLGAQWSIYEQYNYGWAVPFLCAYLFWKRCSDAAPSSVPAAAHPSPPRPGSFPSPLWGEGDQRSDEVRRTNLQPAPGEVSIPSVQSSQFDTGSSVPPPSIPPVARDSVESSSVQSSEFEVQGSKFESDSSAPPAEPPSPPRPGRGNEGEVSIPSVQSSEFKSDCSPPPITVMYSGNFGLAHPFEAILEAVKILDDASSRGAFHLAPVHFVFAGAGPKLSFVREQLAGCRHVEFREPAALENLPAALASADVHLACMSEALLGLVVPSKIYGALAAGRPCLFLGPRDSEAARIILESGRGLVFDPDTGGAALAAVLKRWAARDAEFTACRAACSGSASPASGVPLADFLCVLHRPTTAG